jgi:hypothetical protein
MVNGDPGIIAIGGMQRAVIERENFPELLTITYWLLTEAFSEFS